MPNRVFRDRRSLLDNEARAVLLPCSRHLESLRYLCFLLLVFETIRLRARPLRRT